MRRLMFQAALLAALLLTALPGLTGCAGPGSARSSYSRQAADLATSVRAPRPLTPAEHSIAFAAWRYFERNTHPETGLVDGVDGITLATLEDIAATLTAITAAHQLGLLDYSKATIHLTTLLRALQRIELLEPGLPGPAYHPVSLRARSRSGGDNPMQIDAEAIGELLSALAIVRQRFPRNLAAVDSVVLRWSFCDILDEEGRLFSRRRMPGSAELRWVDDLPLARRQLAAAGFAAWGFNVNAAFAVGEHETYPVEGLAIPYETRPSGARGGQAVLSPPWMRLYLLYGWDDPAEAPSARSVYTAGRLADYAHRVYQAQAARHRRTGIATARAIHQRYQDPFTVVDAVFAAGYPWPTFTLNGDDVPRFAATSSAAALQLWATWDSDYTASLLAAVLPLADPVRGLYEARFEDGFALSRVLTARGNGLALEALLAAVDGPLLRRDTRPGPWHRALGEDAERCRARRQR